MEYYITSDTHYFHKNIIKYCSRPFADIDEMNRVMAERWNAVVGKGDTVFHLGDFGPLVRDPADERFVRFRQLVKTLHGHIILIKGNHDINRADIWKAMDIDFRPDGFHITANGIMLCHYPFAFEEHADYRDTEKTVEIKNHFRRIYERNDCWYLLYGHSHKWISPQPDSYNVGVDTNDFTPLKFNPSATESGKFFFTRPLKS